MACACACEWYAGEWYLYTMHVAPAAAAIATAGTTMTTMTVITTIAITAIVPALMTVITPIATVVAIVIATVIRSHHHPHFGWVQLKETPIDNARRCAAAAVLLY